MGHAAPCHRAFAYVLSGWSSYMSSRLAEVPQELVLTSLNIDHAI